MLKYLAVLVASYFVFGEQIKAANVLGCFFVIAGVFFLSYSRGLHSGYTIIIE